MLPFPEWLERRWKETGHLTCPDHLQKAERTGDPEDLPTLAWPEWLAYTREHNHQERSRRLADPNLNAEILADHKARLRNFGRSRWKGDMYFVGERGGLYRMGKSGRREYA